MYRFILPKLQRQATCLASDTRAVLSRLVNSTGS